MPLEWIDYRDAVRLYHTEQVAYACGTRLYRLFGGTNAKSGRRTVVDGQAGVGIERVRDDVAARALRGRAHHEHALRAVRRRIVVGPQLAIAYRDGAEATLCQAGIAWKDTWPRCSSSVIRHSSSVSRR